MTAYFCSHFKPHIDEEYRVLSGPYEQSANKYLAGLGTT